MVEHCVVKFCSNSDKTGHSVHKFPGDPAIRRQWVAFVKVKRADFSESSVTKHTVLCGAHFTRESYRLAEAHTCMFLPKKPQHHLTSCL